MSDNPKQIQVMSEFAEIDRFCGSFYSMVHIYHIKVK